MEVQTAKELRDVINNNIDVLIHKIEPLTKQNQANVNITQLLTEFYKTVQKSENYHKTGIFILNFAKAATFLDHAFNIYAKQVDLLWDLSINAQRRYLSYEEDSIQKEEAEKRLEQKAQKGKRGRKKKVVVEEPKVPVDWKRVRLKIKKYFRKSILDENEFDFENELDGAEVNLNSIKTFDQLKWVKSWNKLYPKKYVMAPFVDSGFVKEIDDDCYFSSDNTTNYLDFIFPEIQRKLTYNFTENKKLDTIGCDFNDKAFQHFISNEQIINPAENFTAETNQKFQKYLEKYLIEGQPPMSLTEKCKKLCPRRTSIIVTRLSDDIVQKHLKNDETRPSISTDDTGFFETNSDEGFDDSRSGEFMEVSSELIVDPNINNNNEVLIRKRKPIIKDDEEPVLKRRRKRDLFKWLKTTTVSLKRFEKFFSQNYIAENNEGEVKEVDFSSDDDDYRDDEERSHQETHNDSGFLEASFIESETNPNIEFSESELNVTDNFEKREEEAALQRYLEWNQYMKDELKRRNQNEFDIHEYGTKIIDKLSEEKPVGFKEVIENSNSGGGEIARYFAAALQLVNTENIQFKNFESGRVANDLKLILINRNRHHEHLDQYKNASDALIKEKVKKISEKRRCSGYDEVNKYKKIKS